MEESNISLVPPYPCLSEGWCLKTNQGVVLEELLPVSAALPDKETDASKICRGEEYLFGGGVASVASKPGGGFVHRKGRLPKSLEIVLLQCICHIIKLPEPSQFLKISNLYAANNLTSF